MQVRKKCFRQQTVASHAVQKTGRAGLTGKSRRHRRNNDRNRIRDGEPFAAGELRHFKKRRVLRGEGRVIRPDELRQVGLQNKDQAAEKTGRHRRGADIFLRVNRFFGHRRNRIKAQKREAGNRRTRYQRGDRVRAFRMKWRGGNQCARADTVCQRPGAHRAKQKNDHSHDTNQEHVCFRRYIHAEIVDDGCHQRDAEHICIVRNRRKRRMRIRRADHKNN